MNSNEQLIKDFIHKTGPFADLDHAVDKRDLQRLKYHQSAAKQLLVQAEKDTSLMERERLKGVIKWHILKVDHILEKYGEV